MIELVKPQDVHFKELSNTYGLLTIGPLEPGMGTTLGNSLRRVLISMIPGAAVTRVNFDEKYHEYETIDGVKEDVIEILLNIKSLALRLEHEDSRKMYLEAQGEGEVAANQIEMESGVEIVNPDQVIAHLAEDGELSIEMDVEPGMGYKAAEENKKEDSPLSVIPVDSDFSPVKNVDFTIEKVRAGGRENCDELEMEVETDGGIKPEEAVGKAAKTLLKYNRPFQDLPNHPFGEIGELEEEEEEIPEEFEMGLEELGFDQRACNLLKEKGVETLGDLVEETSNELLDIHGFGKKTLQKVEEKLEELGYALVDREEENGE